MEGEPHTSQEEGVFTVSFAREIPGLARQRIGYCALPSGEVAVFSRWEALKDIEISELVDHTFRWVAIEKFITPPGVKQTGPGGWNIDDRLQLQILHGADGERVPDGINGSVRRAFAAKAGDVLQDSVGIYQPLVKDRAISEAKWEGPVLLLGPWRIQRHEDGTLFVKR